LALVGPETKDAARKTGGSDAESVKTASMTAMERHVEGSILAAAASIRAGTFDPLAHARSLHRRIEREAEAAFDARLPTDVWVSSMQRRVRQRWELSRFLSGAGKPGSDLFAILQLPTPRTNDEGQNAA